MSICALSLAYSKPQWPSVLIAPAALLFLISDASLALNRFVSPFPYSGLLIMITYYLAQFLIAWSTCGKKIVLPMKTPVTNKVLMS